MFFYVISMEGSDGRADGCDASCLLCAKCWRRQVENACMQTGWSGRIDSVTGRQRKENNNNNNNQKNTRNLKQHDEPALWFWAPVSSCTKGCN